MSLLDNIKGNRSGDEGDQGGKFNPFRLLEIGEIMVRYTDGIRIKDFVFLAILTSERLILIDSTHQMTGQITKEIPFSVIKQADLERDERDRPSLAISMEVGEQNRVMRLVFTNLIMEPETECREWFTAINGYPPERVEAPEIRLDEPADAPRQMYQESADIVETPDNRAPIPAPVVVTPSPLIVEKKVAIPEPIPAPVPVVVTPSKSRVSVTPLSPKKRMGTSVRPIPVTPVPEGSVRIVIEKPDIHPFRIPVEQAGEDRYQSSTSWKFCIHCGARTPSHSRFCQTCGNRQT
ncbi:MAG: hypothetical protein CVV33_05290 [Methanomicrobiales archaeon HGW-Methanomicrobiales-4]|nr:MAG: hypothetical protein CVV33_05290 [Methanomicrobiales archaeon HGW-Methanomicrobiales-4]